MDKDNELGTLIVVLLKARNLNDKHSFRKQDVFAQATLNGTTKQTAVDIKGGQHPEWDGEVRFPIMKNTGAKFRKLEVACYAKEPRSDDILGKGTVDITETLKTGEFDDWVPLDIDGVQRGDVYLEMTYYANAPPPASTAAPSPNKFLAAVKNQDGQLMRRPSKLKPSERLSRP
ncbi:C2 domain-containing protein, partial [Panaeolus papilionaceus]